MSKTLLRTLMIALVMFAGLGPFNLPQAFLAKPEPNAAGAKGKTTMVEVTFDGLMVFQRVGDHYEVGILGKETAIDHEFKYTIGKDKNKDKKKDKARKALVTQLMSSEDIWRLEVVNRSGRKPADIKPREVKGCNRLQDTIDGHVDLEHVFDFCWITDLEREFHGGQTLTLKPGKLKPIIWLNNGELYTKYNYDELERENRPDGPTWSDLGFVTETVALRVDLQEDEYLVLSAAGREVFRLPTPEGERNAGIFNAPRVKYRTMKHGAREHSHFLYYYELFSNVAGGEKIDIRRKTPARRPLNRFYPDISYSAPDDDVRIRTFDRQACGSVLLGKSTGPLK